MFLSNEHLPAYMWSSLDLRMPNALSHTVSCIRKDVSPLERNLVDLFVVEAHSGGWKAYARFQEDIYIWLGRVYEPIPANAPSNVRPSGKDVIMNESARK
jgi:hypothetical protein